MPELPEVETVRRGLESALAGRRILAAETRRPNLRFPFPKRFADRLTGRRIEAADRRAKYLLLRLDDATVWATHLGMSGRFTVTRPGDPPPRPRRATAGQGDGAGWSLTDAHDHLVCEMEGGARLVFNDPRRFGYMLLEPADRLDAHPRFRDLGPEPLEPGFDGAYLAKALAGRRVSIKAALLDQRIVAGIGNIYACEALHRARISPLRKAGEISVAESDALAAAVRSVLTEAVAAGGSSLRDYVQATGEMGYFQHAFAVYGREGGECPNCDCDGVITRVVQSGRSTFYCSKRQR